jgi:catechol 2,3-dioxygenase-like lactoylglutathione lyase family enzyme
MSLHLFAGIRVRDFQAAQQWYERLLGEPAFFPHAKEAVWTLGDGRSVYVVEHADGAGHSVVTVLLEDLDGQISAVGARGLEPDEIETHANGVRKAVYRDPDGNEFGFGGGPHNTGGQDRVPRSESP